MRASDCIFSYLNLPTLDTAAVLRDLEQIDSDCWFFDAYRNVDMLALYTEGGRTTKQGAQNTGRPRQWTEYAPVAMREYFAKHIFPWMIPQGRIILLRTPPGRSLAEHIDCNQESFGTLQLKLRIALSGNVDDLYFLCDASAPIRPSENRIGVPFVIDGSWPHGMVNRSGQEKLTICLGAPWSGEGMHQSIFQGDGIRKIDFNLPKNYVEYFESPEFRREKFARDY